MAKEGTTATDNEDNNNGRTPESFKFITVNISKGTHCLLPPLTSSFVACRHRTCCLPSSDLVACPHPLLNDLVTSSTTCRPLPSTLPPLSLPQRPDAGHCMILMLGGPVGLSPPLFIFAGNSKFQRAKKEKREEKEPDHGLTTPPFPPLSFFNACQNRPLPTTMSTSTP
jgi:hypothetical protein